MIFSVFNKNFILHNHSIFVKFIIYFSERCFHTQLQVAVQESDPRKEIQQGWHPIPTST